MTMYVCEPRGRTLCVVQLTAASSQVESHHRVHGEWIIAAQYLFLFTGAHLVSAVVRHHNAKFK